MGSGESVGYWRERSADAEAGSVADFVRTAEKGSPERGNPFISGPTRHRVRAAQPLYVWKPLGGTIVSKPSTVSGLRGPGPT